MAEKTFAMAVGDSINFTTVTTRKTMTLDVVSISKGNKLLNRPAVVKVKLHGEALED